MEYEGIHVICFSCGEVGHRSDAWQKGHVCEEMQGMDEASLVIGDWIENEHTALKAP